MVLWLAPSPVSAAPSTTEDISRNPIPQEIQLKINDVSTTLSSTTLSSWFSIQSRLTFHPNTTTEIENIRLCPLSDGFCDFALSRHIRQTIKREITPLFDEESIRKTLGQIDSTVGKDAIDAKFSVDENGRVTTFSEGQEGLHIDADKSVHVITEALRNQSGEKSLSITLPTISIKPNVQSTDASKLGVTELIGEGRSNFAGSPKNRIHNFTHALEQFNGFLIAPKEEFSFVKILGPVDGEHGYLPELVIKQNKTEPEFGGGICQASSTVFRAAIYSGLQITARRNHAYPVRYYTPYGMDATVYIPKPDLRFINNTPGHILIQTSIEGKEVVVRFYGTKDGRTVEVDGPHILESNPDGSMKTVFTQKVTDTQGNVIINDGFKSNYASPNKYPHPGQEPVFTEKPDDWSKKQWEEYKKIHP